MNQNGVHRAKIWQIGGFALNNTATNLYLFFMNFISYYLVGFVGVGVVLASTIIMNMRIWDGVTDPFIGYVVDKTDSKFGKNRPFMLIGNIILAVFSFLIVHVTHKVPESSRLLVFIILYMIYIIGYTFQCVVTKSAQTCLTNDPKQRPMFTIFDGIYNTILFAAIPVLVFQKLIPKYGKFTEEFFHEFWLITAVVSGIFTVIAIFAISAKDRTEFFGLGKPTKIRLRDYWEVLSKNRAIQMLVVSASTDKLALTTQSNAVVVIMVYSIVCGNTAAGGQVAAWSRLYCKISGTEKGNAIRFYRWTCNMYTFNSSILCFRSYNFEIPWRGIYRLEHIYNSIPCIIPTYEGIYRSIRKYSNTYDSRLCRL